MTPHAKRQAAVKTKPVETFWLTDDPTGGAI